MSDEGGPKSAIELAMERFRKKDAEAGITARPLTNEEKAAIAEVKSLYDSRIAEQDILQQSAIRNLLGGHPTEIDEVSWPFRLERERLASERDSKMEKIRSRT